MQLLKSKIFKKTNCINAFTISNVHIFLNEKEKSNNKQEEVVIFELSDTDSHEKQSLEKLWEQEKKRDEIYKKLVQTVKKKNIRFLSQLRIKIFISKCSLNENNELLFCEWKWVSDSESLRICLVQQIHNSVLNEHSERDMTAALMTWHFFWSKYAQWIRQFCRNCQQCDINSIWHDWRKKLLKSLLMSDHMWQEIFMNFIIKLSLSESCINIMMMTDRLSKNVIFILTKNIEIETIAWVFITWVYQFHRLFNAMITNRDTQFTDYLWK